MAFRFRRLREISKSLPQFYSGYYHQHHHRHAVSSLPFSVSPSYVSEGVERRILESGRHLLRFSTTMELQCESSPANDVLSFIKSTLDESEGPNHYWLNICDGKKGISEKDGIYLILADQFLEMTSSDSVVLVENVKFLQHRFPQLHVIGLQCSNTLSVAEKSEMIQFIMREYVSFPILLSNKILEMGRGLCYIISKDFSNPLLISERDTDLNVLRKAIEELLEPENEKSGLPNIGRTTYLKHAEIIKEPYSCSFMQNFILHFPDCISADEKGGRLFLSDSNHNRIVIFNGNGKILDMIGSYPGFEDGEFELVKLARPAASFYHATQDCLYFVDSENHAIRKADLGKRVVETLYPANYSSTKSTQLWSWIKDRLGLGSIPDREVEDFNPQSLMFPWHMIRYMDDRLLILNRSLGTLWTMDLASGKIIEVVKGHSKIMENYGQLFMDTMSVLKQIPDGMLQLQRDAKTITGELPYLDLLSSLTPFQNCLIICDSVGQVIMKYNRESGESSSIQFSNFGVLGLPYWFAPPPEKVISTADSFQGAGIDHIHFFRLLPGKVGIHINVDLPTDIELVESIQEDSIWRQTRGTATEISIVEKVSGLSEKVGSAQQWYDELDSLAFSPQESEVVEDTIRAVNHIGDDKFQIECAVNTSPGTSEVIVYAAVYLRHRRGQDWEGNGDKQAAAAARIADLLYPGSRGKKIKESCIQFLVNCKRDLREVIFVKPLHVRIKLDTLAHPKADNSKGIILTDSSVELNLSLAS
ncbi:Protein SUPPRESSOR OF QUENCHING 1, chloroplastic, partial [Cucurbita argyrosperma subsp. sororia]